MKGISYERQLVNLFWENDFAALRVPASGAGGKSFPKPDIIAGNGHKFYAFEVKTTSSSEIIYLHDEEIQELLDFSEKFGCIPLVAVKFKKKSSKWKFFKISDLEKTYSGNYKIDFEKNFSKGIDFISLL